MGLILRHPLLSLFLLALALRLVAYVAVNYIVFGGEIEHPDSYFFFEKGRSLGARWRTGDLSELFSLRYEDLVGLLFVWLPRSRLVPELVNIVASSLTVVVGYLTVFSIVSNQGNREDLRRRAFPAALFVGLLLAVDPYQVYLSTQILKESLYLFGLSLLLYGLVAFGWRLGLLGLLGLLLVGIMRFQVGLLLVVLVLLYVLVSRLPRFPLPRASLVFLLSPVVALVLGWTIHGSVSGILEFRTVVAASSGAIRVAEPEESRNLTGGLWKSSYFEEWESLSPERLDKFRSALPVVDFEGEVRPPVQHREFFEPRAVVSRDSLLRLRFTPLQLLGSAVDFLTFPRPWTANTRVELAFAGYMLYWYLILAVLILGLGSWRRTWPLLLLGLGLGTVLALTTPGAGGLVRWRLVGFYPLILAAGPALDVVQALSYESRKRLLDVVGAGLLLTLSSPVFLFIASYLKITGQLVFFRQERVGLEGKEFVLYKFTSMHPLSDGRRAERSDERVTKFGSFLRTTALDELPELWTVLKGDMSLVGPRPHAVWDQQHSLLQWDKRHKVKPGLVGLAQVTCHRSDFESKLRWDLVYVEGASVWLDLKLLGKGLVLSLRRVWT